MSQSSLACNNMVLEFLYNPPLGQATDLPNQDLNTCHYFVGEQNINSRYAALGEKLLPRA